MKFRTRQNSRDVPANQSPRRALVAGSSRFPLFFLFAIS